MSGGTRRVITSALNQASKYIVADRNTLVSTYPVANEGDLAYCNNRTAIYPFGFRKGVYQFIGGSWEYGNQELADAILNNSTAISDNDTDILNLQNTKLNKFQTSYHVKDVNELLAIHPANVNNEIELTNAVYFIDSLDFNLGIYKLVTNTDTAIYGYSQLLSQMTSNENNISMIISTGNLFLIDIRFHCTGVNSQVVSINGTGQESLNMKNVELSFGTTGGTCNNIRQFFWVGGFGIGGRGFLLQGAISRAKISETRIINFMDYVLKGDVGMTIDAIRSDANVTIPTGSVAFDFDFNHFNLDGGYQLNGGNYDGSGEMCSNFTNGDSVLPENSKKSEFRNNNGSKKRNTFTRASWLLTNEVQTTFTALNTPVKLNGTTTYGDLVHFRQTTNNQPIYNFSDSNVFYLNANIEIRGTANDIIVLLIRKRNVLNNALTTLYTTPPKSINNVVGLNDFTTFNISSQITLLENEAPEIWVSKLSSLSSLTMTVSSNFLIQKV